MLRRPDPVPGRPGWRRPWSVRIRLAVASAAASAVVLALAGVILLRLLDARLDRDVETALGQRYDAVTAAVSVAGPDAVTALAPSGTTVLPEQPPVAQVLSASGEVVAGTPAGRPPLLDPDQVRQVTGSAVTLTQDAVPRVVRAGRVTTSRGVFVLAVAASLGPNRDAVTRARELLLGAWLPASIVAGLAGWLLAGAALRPVEKLRRTAAALQVRDSEMALPFPHTGDELERLARTLDELVRRLHTAMRDRQDRIAEIAHELRTPLTALRGELEVLDHRFADDRTDTAEGVRAARAAADRFAERVERLLLLGTADRGADLLHLQVVEPSALVADAVRRHTTAAHRAGLTLELRPAADGRADLPAVVCDPLRIGQIVDNLVGNAITAVPPGGRVEVTVSADRSRWQIEVADTGPGFGEDHDGGAERWFTRFRAGTSSASGSDAPGSGASGSGASGSGALGSAALGLGLPIVRELARAHGGDATARDRDGGGAVVVVDLPVGGPPDVSAGQLAPVASTPAPAPDRGTGRRPPRPARHR